MKRRASPWLLSGALAAGLLVASPAAFAVDRRVEAQAQQALKQAAADYLALSFDTAAGRLQKALRACGAKRCATSTRATLLRDLGTMQFRTGDVGRARATWADALRLLPGLALNPDYDAPDLHAAFEATRGGAPQPAAPGAATRLRPFGDFLHAPAEGQKTGVPLAVYVESSGATPLARVLLKYRSAASHDWGHVDLTRVDKGWGGVVPCAAMTRGTLRYWVQGFDASNDPVASGGDAAHPIAVEVSDDFDGEAPHLPGAAAPGPCAGEAVAAVDEAAPEGAPEEKGLATAAAEASPGAYARFWVGVTGMVDFLSLPSGTNVCSRTASGQPGNPAGFACTTASGTDFPYTSTQNAMLGQGNAGSVTGGLQAGDVRVMVSLDYALSASLLLGVRGGYVLNTYPGTVAVSEGRAFGPKIDVEGRLTWLIGSAPLATVGFAPMIFAGAGASEFDGASTTTVLTVTQQPVNAWVTSGPFFVELGAGVRYAFSRRWAFTLAARGNAAFGSTFLATYGPEAGVQYGF